MNNVNKYFKKFVLIILMVCSLIPVFSVSTFAYENTTSSEYNSVEPKTELTGYKYKDINGVLHKRLWSYTYNRWIDSHWTPA